MPTNPLSPARRVALAVALLAVVALTPVLALPGPAGAGAAAVGTRRGLATRVVVEFVATGDPAAQSFRTVGPAGEVRYGNGTLHGTTTIAGAPYDVELLASLRYVDGSGPFTGWWTFTDAAGDRLAFSYGGRTTVRSGVTRITGRVRTIGGTGALVDVTGSGTVRGLRRAEVGSDTRFRLDLSLRRLPAA